MSHLGGLALVKLPIARALQRNLGQVLSERAPCFILTRWTDCAAGSAFLRRQAGIPDGSAFVSNGQAWLAAPPALAAGAELRRTDARVSRHQQPRLETEAERIQN